MSYEITKDCEIANTEYKKGDVISEKDFAFYPSVMKQTDKKVKEKKVDTAKKAIPPKGGADAKNPTTPKVQKTNTAKKAIPPKGGADAKK